MTRTTTQSASAIHAGNKLSLAWPPFAKKLASVLAILEEDQYLILSIKGSGRYIQFAAQGSHGLRAETTSNNYLPTQEQLDPSQIAALVEAGWAAPTCASEKASPVNDPDGSPNFYIDFACPVPYDVVANMAVQTLAKILQVPHPGFLQYQAFDDGNNRGEVVALPELGLKREQPGTQQDDLKSLSEKLLATLRETTGILELDYDDGGDIAVRYGSAMTLVRLIEEPPAARIYSPVLSNVEPELELLRRLNEINANLSMMHFVYHNGVISAVTDVPISPFIVPLVAQSFLRFCELADAMSSLLHEDFGGRTAFEETMPSTTRQ